MENFGYDLNRKCDEIRPAYKFNETCQGSVPESIICFLESKDYEDTVRLAVSMGVDTDTMGGIAGSTAAAFYKESPDSILEKSLSKLTEDIKNELSEFQEYCNEFSS